jgi:hypothetical protein
VGAVMSGVAGAAPQVDRSWVQYLKTSPPHGATVRGADRRVSPVGGWGLKF